MGWKARAAKLTPERRRKIANLDAAGVGANLVADAHLAALAIEYQAEVHSNDSDFSRFPGLR